ncbi:MAG: D-sedoheptulose 7-phosphate isomerase [Candidatus Binatota bacterium]|nr:D-sedoheptulose 7-phosphate isomerase [Candidatus Binatota bacterium]
MSPVALTDSILRKCRESMATKDEFFRAHASRIVECAAAMARAFDAGGRLFAMGNGGSACDAEHVAVEFMHPILEKRPPLPAVALTTSAALLTAIGNDTDFSLSFSKQLRLLGRQGDVALGISTSGKAANVTRALEAARKAGLLAVGFAGRDGGRMPDVCDFCFTVPSFSIHRIQETHETLLHVLWDAVHVVRGEEDVL